LQIYGDANLAWAAREVQIHAGTVAAAMPKGASYGKWIHDNFDASTSWKDIEWIRSIFPGKIILKGILDPEDAKRAVQTDIDGILVSNHGGRQLDSVTSTIRALPKVVAAVQGKVPVFMDSGIRSGLDVLKALALGAKACFVGRAWAYALGAAGESGVRDMLDILREELRVAMILTGCSDVNRATPDLLLEVEHTRPLEAQIMPPRADSVESLLT
jgi:L-lactate dehydrogenase (cytochrome)